MAIRIGQNIASLGAQMRLNEATSNLSKAFERLSSGLRINSASDDPAGLAVASTLKADSRIYSQAIRNISDGISYLSIAEGALRELTDITTRQMELAEQAANGVYSSSQRESMDREANALVEEYNRIAESTKFNGRNIFPLGQNEGELVIQAGYGTEGMLRIDIGAELQSLVGDGTFAAATSYKMEGAETYAVTTADLNGDGIQDMISGGYDASTGGYATIRLGNGDGTFAAATSYQMAGYKVNDVIAADVNGDGILDLLSAGSNSGNADLGIRLGNGDGTFNARTNYVMATSGLATSIAVGDINKDGNLDVAVAGQLSIADGFASIRYGNGNGTFQAATTYTTEGYYSYDISLADLNSDGYLDLVTSGDSGTDARLTVRMGASGGTFAAALSYAQGGQRASAVSLADLNNDGILDVVTVGNMGATGYTTVRLGNGDGTFKASTSYTGTGSQVSVALADINGDGIEDLVSGGANGTDSFLNVRLGNGDGTFQTATSTAMGGGSTFDVTLADVNSDGAVDIVAGGYYGRTKVCLANGTVSLTMPQLDLSTQASARSAIDLLKIQLDRISAELGSIGSFSSRLDVAAKVLGVTRESYSAAASRIEDMDVAEETAALVRNRILQQTASAVLVQANLSPSIALKLLRG